MKQVVAKVWVSSSDCNQFGETCNYFLGCGYCLLFDDVLSSDRGEYYKLDRCKELEDVE